MMSTSSPFAYLILCGYLLMLTSLKHVHCYYYEYDPTGSIVATNLNTSKAYEFEYSKAEFGTQLTIQNSFKGILHKVDPEHGCGRILEPPFDIRIPFDQVWLALIKRSSDDDPIKCSFVDKVFNAQNAGYRGVIVYNDDTHVNKYVKMNADNATLASKVTIPSVFVLQEDGFDMCSLSFPDTDTMTSAEFQPYGNDIFSPYKILIPMAFSFVGILLVTIIVMVVRWCQAINRRRRSRISKSQLKKLPVVKYKKDDQYDCCAICLDDYEEGEKVRLLPCSHTYHQKCIDPWLLKNKRTCPVCKRRVIPKAPRRTRRPSDSTESEDSEPGEGANNERTPLLPPPRGRAVSAVEERPGAAGGSSHYGSAGATGSVQRTAEPLSDADSDDDFRFEHSRQNVAHNVPSGRRRRHSSSSEDISDSDYDLRRQLLVHVSMTPQSYMGVAHSLRSFAGRSGVDDSSLPVPPISVEPTTQPENENSGAAAVSGDIIIAVDQPEDDQAALIPSTNSNQNIIV